MNDMREIGSEYYMESSDGDSDLTELLSGAAHNAGCGIRFLRCGRDALGFIADEIAGAGAGDAVATEAAAQVDYAGTPDAAAVAAKTDGEGTPRTLYIPALCCDSMVLPFLKRGWNIEYYRLNPDLSADTEHLKDLIDGDTDAARNVTAADAAADACRSDTSADADGIGNATDAARNDAAKDIAPVVLVMNYYGITDVASVKSFIRERYPHSIMIEDVTHQVFSPAQFMGGEIRADYVIGSIHKWLGVPDGSFVIGPADMADVPAMPDASIVSNASDPADVPATSTASNSNESDFTRLRRQALLEKKDYIFSDDRPQTLKDHFRELFGEAEDSLEDGIHPMPMSDAAREVLGSADLPDIRAHRIENFTVLRECMSSDPLCGEMYEILNPDAPVPDCPFMLPIVMHIDRIRENSHTAAGQSITRDRFENKLAARGVYAPVLWPIDAQAAEVCDVSGRFAQNMLAFYIDHRYDADDMRYAAEVFADELRAILG